MVGRGVTARRLSSYFLWQICHKFPGGRNDAQKWSNGMVERTNNRSMDYGDTAVCKYRFNLHMLWSCS